MSSPIEGLAEAKPRLSTGDEPLRPRFDPYTGKPVDEPEEPTSAFWDQQKKAAEGSPVPTPPAFMPKSVPHNKYAPTGWGAKNRTEVDITLPSGQLCRVMRIEREDLFRMNLMGYLDTFTPMLMEETISSDERGKRIRNEMTSKPDAIANMFMAIDEVVMAACIRPRVTDHADKVDYGGPQDWGNPNFIATALINDISMDDRFAIFAEAFGRSMDDLKSLFPETPSVASMANESSVSNTAESDL